MKRAKDMVAEANAVIEHAPAAEMMALHGHEDVTFVDLRDPRELEREGMIPRTTDIQDFADRFRFVRQLSDGPSMAAWLDSQRLDEAGFVRLMIRWYRVDTLVTNANLGIFGVEPRDDRVWWLRDALWVSGLYPHASALLDAPHRQRWVAPADDEQAYARDFIDGLASVPAEAAALGLGLREAV